ncbi:hypothetical protein [Litoribaculum gwangyangense]|uniref:Uncharacterized protein n=1 Tax=Litoribaculum gwangyangense TaxID=1130722 RepID=A0ABP9CAY9_9FLAO
MSYNQSKSSQSLIINKKQISKSIIIIWGAIIIFLALADVFINHFEWISSGAIQRLVNITRDDGLPNWFSSIQLLFISIVVWCIFLSLKYSKPNLMKKGIHGWGWLIIALFFMYLAVDDGSKMHERIGTYFSDKMEFLQTYNPGFLSGIYDVFPSYGWQFVFVPIFGAIALFILYFLYKNLESKRQIIYIVLAFGCYVASVVLDFFEGMDESIYDPIMALFDTGLHPVQHFSKLIEEIFEMVGNTLFMLVFTKQLLNIAEKWKIQVVDLIDSD